MLLKTIGSEYSAEYVCEATERKADRINRRRGRYVDGRKPAAKTAQQEPVLRNRDLHSDSEEKREKERTEDGENKREEQQGFADKGQEVCSGTNGYHTRFIRIRLPGKKPFL